jgi:hypothetical protein
VSFGCSINLSLPSTLPARKLPADMPGGYHLLVR